MQYVLKTLVRNPFELLRLARVAWTTFKYRYIHRCAGANTVIGEATVMINKMNIRIGSACLIQDRVYLRAGVDGSIEVGDGAALNSFVQIYVHGSVKIGASTQIGPGTIITTSGHDYRATDLARDNAPIILGDRVWIGANCTILPGVTIGDKAVIGAGAVVAEDIPASCVAVGVPARVVRNFDSERPENNTSDTAAMQIVGQPKTIIKK